MNQNSIILIRVYKGIGIDKQAHGYTLTGKPVQRKFYNGRLCYIHEGKTIGYKTISTQPKTNFEIKNNRPF